MFHVWNNVFLQVWWHHRHYLKVQSVLLSSSVTTSIRSTFKKQQNKKPSIKVQILPPSTGLPSFFCLLLPSSVDQLSRLNLCSSHQAAVHPGNHKLSLAGLKWSVGDWRQAGNDAVLRKGWCKNKQKKKTLLLPPLLPAGTSCLPDPLTLPFPSFPACKSFIYLFIHLFIYLSF